MSIKKYQDQFNAAFDQISEALGNSNTRGLEGISKETFAELNKKISQIIAKSWLGSDPEGIEFKQIFLRGDSEEIKNLLKNHDIDLEGFFGVSLNIDINWDTFGGKLAEGTAPGPRTTRSQDYMLPYPPRPQVVTDEQLERWVNDTNPANQYPLDPYIPLSCC